jgi:hypothetical protein
MEIGERSVCPRFDGGVKAYDTDGCGTHVSKITRHGAPAPAVGPVSTKTNDVPDLGHPPAKTRMGTIEGHKVEHGITYYHFQQDSRLKEIGPSVEMWVAEDEVEACSRPTDAYWQGINELIRHG